MPEPDTLQAVPALAELPTDRYGRRFPYLRLSLTEACNFRCGYCLPDGYAGSAQGFLRIDEIARLLRALAALGMHKIRLTGGEPSLRRDLVEIIALCAATPGIRSLAMTTNGVLLRKRAAAWRAAGLQRINISIDSLDAERFARITGDAHHAELLDGIEHAMQQGFESVKLNVVLLRGLNDDELPAWMDYLRTRDLRVRFIELMQTGEHPEYFARHHLRGETLRQQLLATGWVAQPRAADAGPAQDFAHPAYRGQLGLITPYARGFCASCNRLRVTARGDLRLCLFGTFGIPLRPLLQNDADLPALIARIGGQLQRKQEGHDLHAGNTGITPHLASIGG